MYLSSFRFGDHPERLVAMVARPARAAVIANACDVYPAEDRRAAGVPHQTLRDGQAIVIGSEMATVV